MADKQENRNRIIRHLYTQQMSRQGATPGRLKNALRMEETEMNNALQEMVNEGLIEVLPPSSGDGRGRRSPLILPATLLRGPDLTNVSEVMDTNFTPKFTDQPNPLLAHERARRGSIGNFQPVSGMEAVKEALKRVRSMMERSGGAGFTQNEYTEFCAPTVPDHIVSFVFTRLASPICAEHWMVGGLRRQGNNDKGESIYRMRYGNEATNEHGDHLQTALWYGVDKIFGGNWPDTEEDDERRLDSLLRLGGPVPLLAEHTGYLTDYELDDERLQSFATRVSEALDISVDPDDPFLFCLPKFGNDWYSHALEATLRELALDPPILSDVVSDLDAEAATDTPEPDIETS